MIKKFSVRKLALMLMVLSLIFIMAGCKMKYYTISGLVNDIAGNPIPGASLVIENDKAGTVIVTTDDEGKWSASVAGEELTISVLRPGYKFENDTVTFTKSEESTEDISIEFVGEPSLTVFPAEGTYYGSQTITLGFGGDFTIYYTLDGSEPTEDSNKYTEPFEVSETCTLKVKAFSNSDSSAIEVVTVDYTIDLSKDYGLITNGGFEEGIEPWYGNDAHDNAIIEVTSDVAYEGSNSLYVTDRVTTGSGPRVVLNNDDKLKLGDVLVFSAKVMYDAPSAPDTRTFNVTFKSGDWRTYEIMGGAEIIKGEWCTIEGEFVIGSEKGLMGSEDPTIFVETSWVQTPDPDADLMDFYVDEVEVYKK